MAHNEEPYRDSLEMQAEDELMDDTDAPLSSRPIAEETSTTAPRWLFRQGHRSQDVVQRVRRALQPRFTLRYMLCSLAAFYVAYCWIVGSPLLASRLPQYSGPYNVGTIDLEMPVEARRNISDVVYKVDGGPAFELNTILLSVFYPAAGTARSSLKPHTWISRPIGVTAAGYARAAHMDNFIMRPLLTFVLWLIAGGITIPAQVDVPLADVHSRRAGDNFPIVIFSHGTASSRTDYTHFCGQLASHGVIIAAIEHRDGSGPGSLLLGRDGQEQGKVMYMRPSDLASAPLMENEEFKSHQLAFREAEIEEAVRVMRDINSGRSWSLDQMYRKEGKFLQGWKDRLDLEHLVIAGHSYGATGALQALKGASLSKTRPAAGGIILDPGKSSGHLNTDIDVPVLVIHSNSWSKQHTMFFGRPHFDTVYDLVQTVLERVGASWFITSLGTSHPSVTDAPLIEPLLLSWTTGATIDVKHGVNEYATVSLEFINFLLSGKRSGVLAQSVTHPKYNLDERTPEQKRDQPPEISKDWQIHIAPDTE